MFPFRRGGGKKRGKPQGGHQPGQPGRRQAGGRRIPNSAAELLGALQPTTKSLAQVLAGNTRASGQVVHARNILNQAERLVDDRAVERLPPKQREEFLEQLARLKLTLADADDAADADAAAAPVAAAAPPLSMDRLRELALSIATGAPAPGEPPSPQATGAASADEGMVAESPAQRDASTLPAQDPLPGDATEPPSATPADTKDEKAESKVSRAKRGATLRLKTVHPDPADEAHSAATEAATAR